MLNTRISHYHIIEELGRGGMGVVYRATDTRLGRDVAIKFMADTLADDERSRERFLQEARAAAALNHSNIATLFDIEESDGRHFITMEYVEGRSLKDIISQGPMAAEQALDLAIQAARGLGRAHETGIVHRDIKPANIRVTSRGELKILDFGLAKLADSSDLSQAGTTVGTVAYMSPQQVLGENVDHTSDLWSLGVVLYEMLTGRSPFSQQYVHALYYQILNETAAAVSSIRADIDPRIDGIVERLLEKDAGHRYQTADELADDLVRVRAGSVHIADAPVPSASAAEIRTAAADSNVRRRIERERRQLSIIFCEIADLGDLSATLDPEDLEEATTWFRDVAEGAIRQFGGHPMEGAGGGLVGAFGYPVAHEFDARHAVQCALAVVELASAAPSFLGTAAIRAGVHTGIAIVRDTDGRLEIQGGRTEMAVRIAEGAARGQIRMDKTTQRLCRGYVASRSLGLQDLRGFSDPQPVFLVVGGTAAAPVSGTVVETASAPVVGRDLELAMIRRRWDEARSGRGHAMLISGEAGLGKSSLVKAFLAEADSSAEAEAQHGAWTVHMSCSPLETSTALHAPAACLERLVWPDEDRDRLLDDLRTGLEALGIAGDSDVALVADLLDVPLTGGLELPATAPALRRERLFQVLAQALVLGRADRPGIVVFDELHWSDPSTSEWLELLVEELPSVPVLALVMTRPPERPAWLARSHASELTLAGLSADELQAIASHRAGDKALPAEIVRHVAERTDGVPLFAEELTTMIIESGLLRDAGDHYELTGPLPDHLIPTTLHGSLMARLDQLASAREVAQVGAVIGRRFSFSVLQEVSNLRDDALAEALNELVEADLVTRRGFMPAATFEFKHALVRDAAYSSLLRKKRRSLHEAVARVLVESGGDASPAAIAEHFTEADNYGEAIRYWMEAGNASMRQNANREAVTLLRRARDLVERLPEGAERDGVEAQVLCLLGPAILISTGFSDPEGERIFLRVQELSPRLEDVQPQFLSLYGLLSLYLIRGEYSRSFDLLDRAMERATAIGEEKLLLMAHAATGIARMYAGAPGDALPHLEQSIALHDDERDQDLSLLGWGHLNVNSASARQLALHLVGRVDEALQQCLDTLAMAEGSSNHLTAYHAHLYAGLLHLMRRDWTSCREIMATYLPMALRYGDPFSIGISTVALNLAQRDPDQEAAFREAKSVLDTMRQGGFALGMGFLLAVMAEGFLHYGDRQSATEAIDDALRHLETRSGEFWEAEVYRLKGELMVEEDLAGASPWFDRAAATADAQGAGILRLRIAVSRARHGLAADGGDELTDALSAVEGGDGLAELAEAQALLDALRGIPDAS